MENIVIQTIAYKCAGGICHFNLISFIFNFLHIFFTGKEVNISLHEFSKGSVYLPFKSLMLLDMIATQSVSQNPKVLFFPSTLDHSFYKPLEPLLHPALFGKIYAPWLTDSVADITRKNALERELKKISSLHTLKNSLTSHYADPVTADRTRRYRGELLIAAEEYLKRGDTVTATKVSDSILKFLPYNELLPGYFTIGDTTYYEGKAFRNLLNELSAWSRKEVYRKEANSLDSLMRIRHRQWADYYHSLTPFQRSTFSNRSLHLLKNPDE